MIDEKRARELFTRAVLDLRSGYINNGLRYLERAELCSRDPQLRADCAWWRAQVAETREEKIRWLKEALAWRPVHPEARRELAVLEGRLQPEDIVNPDALPAPPPDVLEVDAERFACPQCGARMVYAPDGKTLYCEHCTSRRFLDSGELVEQDFFVGLAQAKGHRQPVSMQVFHCQGCGAEFTLPPQQISATCAWCDSPHVVALESRRDLLTPDGVVPHRLGKKDALKILAAWARREKRRPEGQVSPPRALYLPVWTFDIFGSMDWHGWVEDTEQGYRPYARRELREVVGTQAVHYDDLLVPASQRQRKAFQALLPTYSLQDARPYQSGYLADWPTELYDIPLADASLLAREVAARRTREEIRISAPPGTQNIQIQRSDLQVSSYKLLLLPVWVTTWPEDGQVWPLLINGQTGQVLCYQPRKLPKWLNWLNDIFPD